MPRAFLAFTLPEEREEHRLALDGGKWYGVACDIDQWLRDKAKYGDQKKVAIEDVRARLREVMQESGVEFD